MKGLPGEDGFLVSISVHLRGQLGLSCAGGTQSISSVEKLKFFATKLPDDLRPVFKLKFIHWGPVEK